ncbi:uncharacterized protein [Dysidea avara]|uniref:uncharacterized protein isoform X1 n=1 Tax=Dysidea avara TaxID=196820 RepID=UPI003316D133
MERGMELVTLAKDVCRVKNKAILSQASGECRQAQCAYLKEHLFNTIIQETVLSSEQMELSLVGPLLSHSYRTPLAHQSKVEIVHKICDSLLQLWHKVNTVTKGLPAISDQSSNATSFQSQYNQLLMDTINSIQVLIDEHQLKEDFVERKYASSHNDAIVLKMNLLATEVLLMTYQQLQVMALKEIQASLAAVKKQLQNEISTASQMLAMYDSVGGSQFTNLAQEYQQLLAEIAHKQWALNELSTVK